MVEKKILHSLIAVVYFDVLPLTIQSKLYPSDLLLVNIRIKFHYRQVQSTNGAFLYCGQHDRIPRWLLSSYRVSFSSGHTWTVEQPTINASKCLWNILRFLPVRIRLSSSMETHRPTTFDAIFRELDITLCFTHLYLLSQTQTCAITSQVVVSAGKPLFVFVFRGNLDKIKISSMLKWFFWLENYIQDI